MTFSSAELIDAVRRRRRWSLRPDRNAGGFPPGWAAWFDAMTVRPGAVTGATAEAIMAVLRAREPRLPPRAPGALSRWQAFNVLWRQQWHPASEDERGIRVAGILVSLAAHVFFAAFLLYAAYVRMMALPEEADSAGEDVIQVEYIGEGTPDEEGGGPPPGEEVAEQAPAAESPQAAPQTAPPQPPAQTQAPTQEQERQARALPTPPSITRPEAVPPRLAPLPRPDVQVPPVEQALQVTETPEPDTTFVVPPVRMAEIRQPAVTPELGVPAPQLEVVEVPAPVAAPEVQPRDLVPAIQAPAVPREAAEVVVREIPAPLSTVEVPSVPVQQVAVPELGAEQAPSVVVRDIPAPAPGPEATDATASPQASTPETGAATQPSTTAAPPGADARPRPAGGREDASQGTQRASTAAGSGVQPSPRPGALPSPKPGDDWGLSDRNVPGGQAGTPGLFDADGTPKLASGDGKVGGGLPPGTITEDFEKIDRNGTWLKRPPFDYTPTAFDRFWVPNETLLQEWVRRSIKEVLIPIPGTSKSIKCSVVLLALGGACDITDPNMQDVEAEARKPPDVPFKPELQENQDALGKPPGSR